MHQDTVFVTNGTNTLEVSLWIDKAATGTYDTLEHDGRNLLGAFIQNLFFEHIQCGLNAFFLRCEVAAMIEKERKGIERFYEPGYRVATIPATGVTSSSTCMGSSAMVGTVPTNHLLSPRESSSHHDTSFICFSTRRGKDRCPEIAWKDLSH